MENQFFAAIDIGTNSFHLIVVKINNDGSFDIIDREKEVMRLGVSETGDMKYIYPHSAYRAIETLKKFKGIAELHNAQIRTVATSAVREAKNKNEFIEQAYKDAGIEIEVISGAEEARLIYLGALKSLPIFDKKTLCIDIGGGSTEFLVGSKGKIHYANSLKLGAVRMSQMFFENFELNKTKIERCERWIEGEIYPVIDDIKNSAFEICVGSSGTIMSSALISLAKKTRENKTDIILNNFTFTRDEIEDVKQIVLSHKTTKERKNIEGLDEKRADIMPAGIIILSKIAEALNLKTITVSGYALREGIIVDAINKALPETASVQLSDVRLESVKHLASLCKYDFSHCQHVADLAIQLFESADFMDKSDPSEKEFLYDASLLHDIGYHIAHSKHHLHSYYIIRNTDLLGYSENEIEIIAQIARYHRKSHPKKRHEEFALLPEKDQKTVKNLASILRIADALDRTHSKNVKELKFIKNGHGSIELLIKYKDAYPEIDLWSFERRKGLFEEVFNSKLKIKVEKL